MFLFVLLIMHLLLLLLLYKLKTLNKKKGRVHDRMQLNKKANFLIRKVMHVLSVLATVFSFI
ncbi:hypothetical protein BDA99DRAFT_500190, partial [Phascolomyces articulosus]